MWCVALKLTIDCTLSLHRLVSKNWNKCNQILTGQYERCCGSACESYWSNLHHDVHISMSILSQMVLACNIISYLTCLIRCASMASIIKMWRCGKRGSLKKAKKETCSLQACFILFDKKKSSRIKECTQVKYPWAVLLLILSWHCHDSQSHLEVPSVVIWG